MSKSTNKVAPEGTRLVFEHTDRQGRVSLLPLSHETQRLFMASLNGTSSGQPANDAGVKPVTGDIGEAAQSLTPRQLQICDLLIAGLSSKQIGYELSISPRTVEVHRGLLMRKMGVRNTASLVRVALLAA